MAKTTKEEKQKKEQLKKDCKAAGKAYAKMMKPMEKGEVPFDYQKEVRAQFLQEYKEIIEEYINYASNKTTSKEEPNKISDKFQQLLTVYKKQYSITGETKEEADARIGVTATRLEGTSKVIHEGLKSANAEPIKNERSSEDINSQDNLTSAQMAGLKDISRWMLRNMNKTGLFGDSKEQFVKSFILKQPARLKLCAYYLVETNARKLTGASLNEAIRASQSPSYVPNLERFKDKMIASKFKFWTRFTADQFYWEKLAQSMRFAISQTSTILLFGNMGNPEVTESDGNESGTETSTGNKTSGSGAGSVASGKGNVVVAEYKAFKESQKN